MVETAQVVAKEWELALQSESSGDYDEAMTHLANVSAALAAMPLQVGDIKEAAEEALDAFEAITETSA